jgi:membrane protease YdiL (CAAX protease family)
MSSNIPSTIIKQHPLAAFFVLATALSWWLWPLYALDLTPTPMFGAGPFVAALVVLGLTRGKAGIVDLLRRMGRWRVGLGWYAAALLLPVVVTFTAAAINVFLLGAETSKSAAELGGWSSLVPTFLILLLVPGLGGTWEEPGFRGYALTRLQRGRSALAASLILGVLWAFWHLPLFLTGLDTWNESVQIIAWTVVFAWLLNNTGQSVLLAMLMHNMSNTISGSFVSQMFSGVDSVNQAWLRGALWCVVAVVVAIATGPGHLSRRKAKRARTAPRPTELALGNSYPNGITGSRPVTDEAPPRLAAVAQ